MIDNKKAFFLIFFLFTFSFFIFANTSAVHVNIQLSLFLTQTSNWIPSLWVTNGMSSYSLIDHSRNTKDSATGLQSMPQQSQFELGIIV